VVGQRATASPDFSLADIAGTSGRLDVLLRCVRAALLYSHGVRADTVIYVVLGAGPAAPRTLRFDGASARFLRPDERSLATLVKKCLAHDGGRDFVQVRPGVSLANDGLAAVLRDLGTGSFHVLDEHGTDVRSLGVDAITNDPVFFIGDHLGLDADVAARLATHGAHALSVGPTSVHAEDVVTLLVNELDRRDSSPSATAR
jgi:tRNA (pseudouridine54-N1)-methyltransferase